MDPNTCLRELSELLAREEESELDADFEAALDKVDDLREWLAGGGFEPDWLAYPKAAGFYYDHVNA